MDFIKDEILLQKLWLIACARKTGARLSRAATPAISRRLDQVRRRWAGASNQDFAYWRNSL